MPPPECSLPVRPEDELVLLAARSDLVDLERFRTATARVEDWPGVERLAGWHGLSPLLYHHLSNVSFDSVPADVLARLRDDFLLNSRRSVVQIGELLGVLEVLRTHGIPAIPYKGPIASAALYENPAYRVAGDLDILVRPDDASAARRALESAGYRSVIPLSPQQDSVYRRHAVGYSLISPHHSTIVDLQWELSPKRFTFRPPVESFWSRLAPIEFRGTPVDTFCPRDTLVVLCLHGSKHVWESLKWLVDVAELVRRHPDLDYEGAFADSDSAGCRRVVNLGLLLAARHLQAPVPSELVKAAESDSGVRWMAERIRYRLFNNNREGRARIEMMLEDSALKQARYLYYRLFMPFNDEWNNSGSGVVTRARRPLRVLQFLIMRSIRK